MPDDAEMHRLAHIKKEHMTNQKTVEIKNMDKDDVYTLLGKSRTSTTSSCPCGARTILLRHL